MEILVSDTSTHVPLRLFTSAAHADFPSPAEGSKYPSHSAASRDVFGARCRESMIGAGIDILIVDRSLTPLYGDMSGRVNAVLFSFAPRVENYSAASWKPSAGRSAIA